MKVACKKIGWIFCSNLKNDGDPMSDFFCTLHKVVKRDESSDDLILTIDTDVGPGGVGGGVFEQRLRQGQSDEVDSRTRAIVMAFKADFFFSPLEK